MHVHVKGFLIMTVVALAALAVTPFLRSFGSNKGLLR